MKLFRKKTVTQTCCKGACTQAAILHAEQMKKEKGIKILGSGCAKCIALEKATRIAIDELGIDLDIQHITDFTQIASYGVMTTPALVLNGRVVSYGKVLSKGDVVKIIETNS